MYLAFDYSEEVIAGGATKHLEKLAASQVDTVKEMAIDALRVIRIVD